MLRPVHTQDDNYNNNNDTVTTQRNNIVEITSQTIFFQLINIKNMIAN